MGSCSSQWNRQNRLPNILHGKCFQLTLFSYFSITFRPSQFDFKRLKQMYRRCKEGCQLADRFRGRTQEEQCLSCTISESAKNVLYSKTVYRGCVVKIKLRVLQSSLHWSVGVLLYGGKLVRCRYLSLFCWLLSWAFDMIKTTFVSSETWYVGWKVNMMVFEYCRELTLIGMGALESRNATHMSHDTFVNKLRTSRKKRPYGNACPV